LGFGAGNRKGSTIASRDWSEVTDFSTGVRLGGRHIGNWAHSGGQYSGEGSTALGITARKGVKQEGVK